MIALKTLGRGAIHRDGLEVAELESRKLQCAVLLFLAMEGPVSRDRLLAVFWPERDRERARHSLSQTLYSLRRELGEECVRSRGDQLEAACDAIQIDALELEVAAQREDWEKVIALYEGPFLDQYSLPGAPEFEKWCSRIRVRLARTAHRAFSNSVEGRAAADDLQSALCAAWRWVALEPLEDEAQHALIALLARTGDRAAALDQYEAYRARLARELDVEPLEKTVALVERIRSGALPDYRPLAAAQRPAKVASTERLAGPSAGAEPTATPEESAAAWPAATDRRRRLLDEFRSRLVWQVGAAYLAVSWATMQFVGTLSENAVLPALAFQILLGFLSIGFLMALGIAWALEQPRASPLLRERLPGWVRRARPAHVLTVLFVLVLGLLAGRVFVNRAFALPEPPIEAASGLDPRTVAVIPFDVITDLEEDLTWLTLGLTDNLIGALSEVDELTVRPFTAVKRYLYAKPLGDSILVDLEYPGTLVEGTIVASAELFQLNVQLVDVTTWSVVESKIVDWPREAPPEQVLQNMSAAISGLIRESLGIQLRELQLRAGTQDPEAWKLYNLARRYSEDAQHLYREGDKEAALRMYAHADSLFERAEARDERWPDPIVERGEITSYRAWILRKGIRARDPDELREGLAHADRALVLEPGHPGALELRGALRNRLKETAGPAEAATLLRGAEEDLRAANTASAWFTLADVLRTAGRFREARRAAYRAYERGWWEPRWRVLYTLCHAAVETEDWDDIHRWCEQGRREYPEKRYFVNVELWLLALPGGPEPDVERAWQLHNEFLALSPASQRTGIEPAILMHVAAVLARAEKRDSARAVISHARALQPEADPMTSYLEAYARYLLDEPSEAIRLLGHYLNERPSRKPYVSAEWIWGSLKAEPAFQELVGE